MDSTRFDQLTRTFSTRLSRRRALATGAAGLSALAFAGRSLPGFAQDATPQATPVSGQSHPPFMFVQLADSGSWMPKPDEDGVYLLSLSGAGDQTLFFSDGNYGTFATDHMLKTLGFTPVNPPNAAVVVTAPDGTQDVLVIELLNPIYRQVAEGDDQLVYEAKVLNVYTGNGLEEWVPQADDDQLPTEFTNVSLFIDDCADASQCFVWIDGQRPRYVGEIPGGPYRICFDGDSGACYLCEGSYAEFNALCRKAFPEGCAQGVCFTNVCDYPDYFGEMYFC
jgi:hypothetical protein